MNCVVQQLVLDLYKHLGQSHCFIPTAGYTLPKLHKVREKLAYIKQGMEKTVLLNILDHMC